MTSAEVKQLNAKLQQRIQGKESMSENFACENVDTENPLQQGTISFICN